MERYSRNKSSGSVSMLHRGDEYYIVVYNTCQKTEACRCVGSWASNPQLKFTWYDAARMAQSIRENCKEKN